MDSHTQSLVPERLEVIEVGRRRCSDKENLRIVTECLEAPRLVSATARRYGITRSQLMARRRALKVECVAFDPAPAFVPIMEAPEPAPRRRAPRQAAQGRMVIEVGRDWLVVVDGAPWMPGARPRARRAGPAIPVPSAARMWITAGHIDMRRGMNGLSPLAHPAQRLDAAT